MSGGMLGGQPGQGPYRSWAGGVVALPAVGAALARVDLLVFDLDGVLIDTAASYPLAVEAAIARFCVESLHRPEGPVPVTAADLPAWKAAGGFNDDWHLAQGVCLFLTRQHLQGAWPVTAAAVAGFCSELTRLGGGLEAARRLCPGADSPAGPWDPAAIARSCMEHYGGDDGCRQMFGLSPARPMGPGLWRRERALVDPLQLAPWRGRLAVYTGRNAAEAACGLEATGLAPYLPPAHRQTSDGGPGKPDPRGLLAHAAAFRPRLLLFAGDTPDDAETVVRYRQCVRGRPELPPALFAGVRGGAAGALAEPAFRRLGADLIVDDARALLRVVSGGPARPGGVGR